MASKTLNKVTLALNTGYALIVVLFLMDAYSRVEIKWQPLKTVVYAGLILGSVLLLLWNVFDLKNKVYILLPLAMFIYCLTVNPIVIINNSGVWHTQELLYQNKYNATVIEGQMRGMWIRYQSRTVQVRYLTPLFAISNPVPVNYKHNAQWYPVFKEINQMGLKSP